MQAGRGTGWGRVRVARDTDDSMDDGFESGMEEMDSDFDEYYGEDSGDDDEMISYDGKENQDDNKSGNSSRGGNRFDYADVHNFLLDTAKMNREYAWTDAVARYHLRQRLEKYWSHARGDHETVEAIVQFLQHPKQEEQMATLVCFLLSRLQALFEQCNKSSNHHK